MATRITSAVLAALDVTLRANFNKSYQSSDGYMPWADRVAVRVPSDSTKNTYPLVVDSGAIREWNGGERHYNTPVESSFELTNKKYELSYEVSRDWIEDDKTGLILPTIRGAGRKYRIHPDNLLAAVFNANPATIDGRALFHDAHYKNGRNAAGGTFDNDKGLRALTPTNAATTRAEMLALTGPDGDPMVNPGAKMTLIVPPSRESDAMEIAGAQYFPDGSGGVKQNVMAGKYDVLVIPQLEALSSTTWYMGDLSDPDDRPFTFQERVPLEFVQLFNPTDPNVFNYDVFRWGTRVRYVAGPGNPWKIQRCQQ